MRRFSVRSGAPVVLLLLWAARAGAQGYGVEQLLNQSDASYAQSKYEDALRFAQAAEARARASDGRPNDLLALALMAEARSLGVLGRHADAERPLIEALRIVRTVHGERSDPTATVLNSLSDVYFHELQFSRALPLLEEATGIARSVGDQPLVAVCLINMGHLKMNLRDYPGAAAVLEEAVAIDRRLRRTADLPDALHALSSARAAAGQTAAAEAAAREALAIDERAGGRGTLGWAQDQCTLAALLATSRRDEALERYDQCLSARQRLIQPGDPRYGIIAETIEGIASFYSIGGDHERVVSLRKRALDIRVRAFGATSLDVGLAGVRLGRAYFDAGQVDLALKTAAAASAILKQNHATGPNLEEAQYLLGEILMQVSDREYKLKGVRVLHELADGQRRSGELAMATRTLLLLGAACTKVDDRTGAFEAFDAALALRQRLYGDPSLEVSYGRMALGAASYWFHDYRRSAQEFGAAFENWRKLDGRAAESPFSDDDTNTYVDSLWRTREEGARARDREYGTIAFAVSQLSHHSEAAHALALLSARLATSADPTTTALVRRDQDNASARERAQREYADVLANDGSGTARANLEQLRGQLRDADVERDRVRHALAARVPAYAALAGAKVVNIAEAQSLLRDGELLIAFNFGPQGGFVWGISRRDFRWAKLDLTTDALAGEVTALRRGLDSAAPAGADNARGLAARPSRDLVAFDRTKAYGLYRSLLAPLGPMLAGAHHLLFVPEGALESLPPAVLVTQPPTASAGGFEEYRKTAWLVRDKAITILPSISALEPLRPAPTARAARPFLGVGAPLINRFTQLAGCADERSRQQAAKLATLGLLDGMKPELLNIAQTLGARGDDVLVGPTATTAELLGRALREYRVLVFATHGLVAREVPGLVEPALVLTPAQTCGGDPGLLTASRVAQMDLAADWVVLSACNTASSDGSPRGRGLSGLARAFIYAGTRSVLVSHWAVRDMAATRLTTGVFAEMSRDRMVSRAEALRRSMLAMIDDRSTPAAAHPSFWAPFVLVGGPEAARSP